MPISYTETVPDHTSRFRSKHCLRTGTVDGKEMLVISGIVVVDIKGAGSEWRRDKLSLTIDLNPVFGPNVPKNKGIVPEQWVVLITPTSIFDQNEAKNAGFAVDQFRLVHPPGVAMRGLTIEADVAVRDVDAWLYRVAYHLTVIGRLGDLAVIP